MDARAAINHKPSTINLQLPSINYKASTTNHAPTSNG
jgi:hypothetical protein